MRVKVQYLGPIRVVASKREEELDVSIKSSLLDLLKRLSDAVREEI